jgi:hypothetical protein
MGTELLHCLKQANSKCFSVPADLYRSLHRFTQIFNSTTLPAGRQVNNYTTQQLHDSTTQQFNNSTIQQLNNSTSNESDLP